MISEKKRRFLHALFGGKGRKSKSSSNVSMIMNSVLKTFGKLPPEKINRGYCGVFAVRAMKELIGSKGNYYPGGYMTGEHFWVSYKNKNYDAAHLKGVSLKKLIYDHGLHPSLVSSIKSNLSISSMRYLWNRYIKKGGKRRV